MAKLNPGDSVTVGQVAWYLDGDQVVRQKVTVTEKRFNLEGVQSRITKLEEDLQTANAIKDYIVNNS
jgi:hypothetical protein